MSKTRVPDYHSMSHLNSKGALVIVVLVVGVSSRLGWMLLFWNVAGVPLVYSAQSIYLLKRGPGQYSPGYTAACFTLLLAGYYLWDTANSQQKRCVALLDPLLDPLLTPFWTPS
eukprot:1191643-Prorocentrum_minimum.AAC.1